LLHIVCSTATTQQTIRVSFAVKIIQLLYAENVVSRTANGQNQRLGFYMSVENLAYEKCVEIHWGTPDGTWRVLPAHYARPSGSNREVWEAEMFFPAGADGNGFPGDISFAVHVAMAGVDYWDSNDLKNYVIKADSGVFVHEEFPLLAVKVRSLLSAADTFLPVTVAVHQALAPKKIFVHWSTDSWRTVHTTECYFWRQHWEKHHASHAQNPNEHGTSIWVTHLPVNQAFRLEYAIGCETAERIFWDNNAGTNYVARHERLKVLTLNLHCYQEENQQAKLSTIANAIDDHDVDIVCLQEVAEPWNGGNGASEANTARLINDRLKQPYHIIADWSHRGFDIYREGCAILTRHDVVVKDSGYISSNQDPNSIHARRVVMAQVSVPFIGFVNVYSAHLSWWKDGFREQFENLRAWANEKHSRNVTATLILGDFNAQTGSDGYMLATYANEFEDQHLKIQRASLSNSPNSAELPNDGRIDFIFLKKDSALEVKTSKVLFTNLDYGRVSDHEGYYAEFEPT
jgi:maltose 6'-phosphate phosphatase